MERKIETKCLHLEEDEGSSPHYGAISFPIYQSATYAHLGVGKSTGYDYSRLQNPTREHLEKVVASLENGKAAFAFSSGMAAISMLMELFEPGDHIIADSDLYGGSIRLFRNVSAKNGITFSDIDCSRENAEDFITPATKAIYIETPTNPMMNVTDISELAKIAKKHGLLLIVDNTFLSPYFQNPLDLGADITVHSGTKYLSGHNDTLAGFLVTNRTDISEKFAFLIKTTGAGLAPFDALSLGERHIADVLTDKLKAIGFEVCEDSAGNAYGGNAGNIYGYLPGSAEGDPVLFSAHMDTVSPGIGKKRCFTRTE